MSVLSPLFLYIYFCTSQIVYLTWPWHFNLRISICLSQFVYLHWRWYFNLCIYFCTVPSGGKSLFSERTGGRCLKKETKERPKHEHKSRARRISETCVKNIRNLRDKTNRARRISSNQNTCPISETCVNGIRAPRACRIKFRIVAPKLLPRGGGFKLNHVCILARILPPRGGSFASQLAHFAAAILTDSIIRDNYAKMGSTAKVLTTQNRGKRRVVSTK